MTIPDYVNYKNSPPAFPAILLPRLYKQTGSGHSLLQFPGESVAEMNWTLSTLKGMGEKERIKT